MPVLPRADAIALSAELCDLVVKLRILEAKYGLEDHGESSTGLGINLLSALREYGHDPEVAANALRAGLNLLPSLDIPSNMAHGFSKQVSQDSISVASTTWSPQVTSSTTCSEQPVKGPGYQCLGLHSGETDSRQRLLTASAGQWTFSVEHGPDATVLELRKLLASTMRLPLGKMQAMAEADGTVWALADHDKADLAKIVFVRSVSTASAAAMLPVLTLEQALAVQEDFLESLNATGRRTISRELGKDIQEKILLKHGLKPSPSGMAEMLRSFDIHATNSDVRRLGEQINEVLGMRPQVYRLQFIDNPA